MSEYFYLVAALAAVLVVLIAGFFLVKHVKNSTEARMNDAAFLLLGRMYCRMAETFEIESQHFIVSAASENLTQNLCGEVVRIKPAIFYSGDSNQFLFNIAVKRIREKIHHMEGLRVHYKSRSDNDLITNIINLLHQTEGRMRMLSEINEAKNEV